MVIYFRTVINLLFVMGIVIQQRPLTRETTDERILGSGDFVERVLKEADEKTKGA